MTELSADQERATIARVVRRLVPFMFLCYVIAYIDRVNIGFAATELQRDLGLSDAAYGLGGGLFFLGYCLFEIPSNLILERVGARVWIARIMIVWGLVSMAMMFVVGQWSFYAMRVLLGIAEAGFFPGMVLYLTYWVPAAERAKTGALFMTAAPVAVLVGSPVSEALLALDGRMGLAGWQWLFLVEGFPAVVLGVIALWFLTDRPEQAAWLPPAERDVVERQNGARACRALGPSSGVASQGAPERTGVAHLLHLLPQHARHLRHFSVAAAHPARRVGISRLAPEPGDVGAVPGRARRHGADRPAFGSDG